MNIVLTNKINSDISLSNQMSSDIVMQYSYIVTPEEPTVDRVRITRRGKVRITRDGKVRKTRG